MFVRASHFNAVKVPVVFGTLAWYARGFGSIPSGGSTLKRTIDQGSSNGKTLAFGPSYKGSIPFP